MNKFKLKFHFVFMLGMALIFSTAVNAQNRHHNYYNHNYYNSGHYSHHNYPVRYSSPYRYPNYFSRPIYRSRNYYPFVYRLPHYNHYGPSFGFRLSILPFGYNTIYFGPSPYYYNDGIFYRPYSSGGYEVTPPPIGATVPHLPTGAKLTMIDGQKYFELGGTFYQEEISSSNKVEYKVVGADGVLNTGTENQVGQTEENNPAPITGSRVDQLPADSKVVVINRQKYYLSPDGVYYNEVIEGNTVKYEVSGVQQ